MATAKPGISAHVTGVRSLAAAMREMGHDLTDLRDVNLRVAIVVAERAVRYAPDLSGDLRVAMRAKATRYRAKVSNSKVYAGPVHWGADRWPRPTGTGRLEPTEFAARAAADTESRWLPMYEAEMQRLCDKVAASVPPGSR